MKELGIFTEVSMLRFRTIEDFKNHLTGIQHHDDARYTPEDVAKLREELEGIDLQGQQFGTLVDEFQAAFDGHGHELAAVVTALQAEGDSVSALQAEENGDMQSQLAKTTKQSKASLM